MTRESRRSYEFDRFRLDAVERVLWRDGAPMKLGPKVIETLIVLVENAGHIVEKNELITRVWPDSLSKRAAWPRTYQLFEEFWANAKAIRSSRIFRGAVTDSMHPSGRPIPWQALWRSKGCRR